MRKARTYSVLVVVLAALMLSACAAGPNEMVDTGPDPAGFWLGLWQGLISPITFLISLFTPEVNIYEVQNNGNWYDFGFMLGVVMAFGGGAGGGTASAGRYRRRGKPRQLDRSCELVDQLLASDELSIRLQIRRDVQHRPDRLLG